MLKPEQAQKALEQVRLEDWGDRLLANVAKLPAPLRPAGRAFLGRDAQGREVDGWDRRNEARLDAAAQLDRLPARERVKVFAALFPRLSGAVEGGWQLSRRLPYQSDYDRKAFRTPNSPAGTLRRRADWLESLLHTLDGYDQDVRWLAAWAAHLGGYGQGDALGVLFAAVLDAGGPDAEAVYETLIDSALGQHEIGGMGRHVTRALLVASRPEGWEFVEKMLLAAQRQEGLRQTVLETADEAHPEAFRRLLRLVLEHDLARFSSVVRALDVWFGFQWDAVSTRVVNRVLEQVVWFLEDPDAARQALASGDAETVYLALWSLAFHDAVAAVGPAAGLLADGNVERRFVAAHLLGQLDLPAARAKLRAALGDEDLRVALRALEGCRGEEGEAEDRGELFEPVERVLARLPEKRTHLDPLVWPWQAFTADRQAVASELPDCLGDRPATRLLPYLHVMEPWTRAQVVGQLAAAKKWDAATRDALLALAGDGSGTVRDAALKGLAKCKLHEDETEQLEGLLTRKSGDVRQGVLSLLLGQKDAAALASADRLLAAPQQGQRVAGLELLRQLAEARRAPDECRRRAEAYRAARPRLAEEERKHIDAVLDSGWVAATLDDALGLMDPSERTRPAVPRKRNVALVTPATVALVQALDDLVHEHRETSVTIKTLDDLEPRAGGDEPEVVRGRQELLGNVQWGFPSPNEDVPFEKDVQRLPLRALWEGWWRDRPKALRDKDGCELLRALVWASLDPDDWKSWQRRSPQTRRALDALAGGEKPKEYRHGVTVQSLLAWLVRLFPPPAGAPDFLLDALETSFSLVPREELTRRPDPRGYEEEDAWRSDYDSPFALWLDQVRRHQQAQPGAWTPEHAVRLFRLLRWCDEPGVPVKRDRPDLDVVLAAYTAGGATSADLLDQLLGPRADEGAWAFRDLGRLTRRRPPKEFERFPYLRFLVDRCRERILEVELTRGDTPTAASDPACALESVFGIDNLVRFLHAMGKDRFDRGRSSHTSRAAVLTHLIDVTYPREDETKDEFAARMKEAGFGEERLIELAFEAPQWVAFVEHALGWPGFAEGVWWFLAHTRDAYVGGGDEEETKAWEALVRQRTALSGTDLAEGAVDVAWFHQSHEALGPKRWQALSGAAKYASWSGNGYRRALFLTDVLLGRAKKSDLVSDVRRKHAREAVRALGLLPLAGGAARERDLLDRYQVLQEYLRYARQLSAMSKEGALRTAAVGIQNLARTAGYPDPVRFEWAMEARAVADLAAGPVTATAAGVSVALSIDADGQPQVTAEKAGRTLKSIPAPVKKNAKVAELLGRKAELKRQASRVRNALEAMMCRGDTFTGAELRQLFAHPVLAPRLERLLLVGDGIVGYAARGGQALCDHSGKLEPVKKDEALRVAHPLDLFRSKQWHHWQRDCFERERVQPFKQVFRELYLPTAAEKADGTVSRRYAGQQVNPRQASALWGSRGWVVSPEEGVARTFHDAGLTARVEFLGGYFTPAEVEGLTLEGVRFYPRGEWKPLKLTQVPPLLFSEVMRDLDLVVSVAHRGGVDPEASASTVEMRAALLRETCELLQLSNVRLKGPHALVAGELASYTVHLGSAVVHRQPGGALCLVPVHSQHRGRLFLPFADDDPKTAEVIAKVLLLARDTEIQDPTLLDQIRAR